MLVVGLVAFFTLVADLGSKYLASRLPMGADVSVVPGLLTLRLTHNDGIALGLMSGNKIALLVLPVLIVVLGGLMLSKYRSNAYVQFCCGLILGGFLGNFAERLLQGYVVDMLYFPFLPWFVCNVADIAVCFGVALLVFSLLFRPQDWREKDAKD